MTDISTLFPLKFTITQEIIDMSSPLNAYTCIGANSLRIALGDFANGRNIMWGNTLGSLDELWMTTEENIAMPLLKSPVQVTFIVMPNKSK